MTVDIGNTNPPHRQSRMPIGLGIGLLLTFLGAAVLIGPLLYAMQGEPTDHANGAFIIGLPLFLFISTLFLAFGLTVLFSQVVDYSAVGAGRVKILGLEMPMEFQGAAMVLFLLLLGMGASIKLFGLMSINSQWTEWTNLESMIAEQKTTIAGHEGVKAELDMVHFRALSALRDTHASEIATLKEKTSNLEGQLSSAKERAEVFRDVLIAQATTRGSRLIIRFKCSQYDDVRFVNWTGPSNERTGNLLTYKGQGGGENSTELPSRTLDPHTLKGGSQTTYTIMSFDERTKRRVPVISARFHYQKENLVATIWPNSISLRDLCASHDKPLRSSAVLDGQAPIRAERSWQDEAELGLDF